MPLPPTTRHILTPQRTKVKQAVASFVCPCKQNAQNTANNKGSCFVWRSGEPVDWTLEIVCPSQKHKPALIDVQMQLKTRLSRCTTMRVPCTMLVLAATLTASLLTAAQNPSYCAPRCSSLSTSVVPDGNSGCSQTLCVCVDNAVLTTEKTACECASDFHADGNKCIEAGCTRCMADQFEAYMNDIDQDPELRGAINLYKGTKSAASSGSGRRCSRCCVLTLESCFEQRDPGASLEERRARSQRWRHAQSASASTAST